MTTIAQRRLESRKMFGDERVLTALNTIAIHCSIYGKVPIARRVPPGAEVHAVRSWGIINSVRPALAEWLASLDVDESRKLWFTISRKGLVGAAKDWQAATSGKGSSGGMKVKLEAPAPELLMALDDLADQLLDDEEGVGMAP